MKSLSACPKCGNEEGNEELRRVGAVWEVPARIIYQCSACPTIWYVRDPQDMKEQDDTDQT